MEKYKLIDKDAVEAMIIFAYKQEEYKLVEELLKVLQKFQALSNHVEKRTPQMKLLQCMDLEIPDPEEKKEIE